MDASGHHSHRAGNLDLPARDGRVAGEPSARTGRVFFLARGGLRSLSRSGEPFLGYGARELFWRDVFGLVHHEDLPPLEARISSIMRGPGTTSSIEVRVRDASGAWRRVEAGVQNVLEGPGDIGLLVVDLRDISSPPEPDMAVRASYRDALEDLLGDNLARGNGLL